MIPVERVLREKRSLMLPLLIALAVNVGVAILVVLPLMRSVSSEEARATEVARDRAEAERAYARAEAIVTGKSRADTELARFYGQILPRDQVGARRITYLNLQQLARAAGVTFSGQSTTVRDPEEGAGLTKYSTELTMTGSYRGIRQFIHAVETQPAFLVIESLSLERASGENEPLEITVRLSTYYRESDGG